MYIAKQKKIEEKGKNSENESDEIQKSFHDFFYFWIGRLLNDSMYWRGIVGGCLKNGKKTCGKQKCKGECDCFQTRIEKKKNRMGRYKNTF